MRILFSKRTLMGITLLVCIALAAILSVHFSQKKDLPGPRDSSSPVQVGAFAAHSPGPLKSPSDVRVMSSPIDGVADLFSGISFSGLTNMCLITLSHGAKCWGDNTRGQLGDGTTTSRSAPVDVVGLYGGIRTMALGGDFTCAILDTGGVKCWGDNTYGQLGNGAVADHNSVPVTVSIYEGVRELVVQDDGACALTTAGGVKCWGDNSFGQLGSGTNDAYSSTPVDVIGLSSGVSSLAKMYQSVCALTTAGGVKCWGHNTYGQLGDGFGSGFSYSTIPVDVIDLSSGVRMIAASFYGRSACALTTAGGVKCWGAVYSSYAATTARHYNSIPIPIEGLSGGVKSLTMGNTAACAILDTGGVKCWGDNSFGQLGNGIIDINAPGLVSVDVIGLSGGVSTVAIPFLTSCALTTAGGVKCWGSNMFYQLGDGSDYTEVRSAHPVDVVGLSSGVTGLTMSPFTVCALTTAGGVKCWGDNSHGQLGNCTTTSSSVPVDVQTDCLGTPATPTPSPTLFPTPTPGGCPGFDLVPASCIVAKLQGDADCDGMINLTDLTTYVRLVNGYLPKTRLVDGLPYAEDADFTRDCETGLRDRSILIQTLSGSDSSSQANDRIRSGAVNSILNAMTQFKIDNRGTLPTGAEVSTTPLIFSSNGTNMQLLCQGLTGTGSGPPFDVSYIAQLPFDPSPSLGGLFAGCSNFNTGYVISQSETGRITVSAPGVETPNTTISVTR